jgi:diguanylate cyclase (GGDEF)-like protein
MPMDTRTSTYPRYYYEPAPELQPVAVTRWMARLADPRCEFDYRASRFADDRCRGMILMALASVAGALNFLVQLDAYSRGAGTLDALLPPFASIWLPILGLLIVQRLRSPAMLEAMMAACIAVGTVTRLALVTLHPVMTYMWPTLIVGIVFVIYLYLPVRFTVAVALAAGFSIVAPTWWLLSQGALLPPDQFYRGLIWLLFANALGFIAANSLQRSQRAQFAQSLVLKHLLSTDAMTGIGNRRRFDDALDREWRRCGRSGQPLSLLMIDVDHFKAYNDHYGHQQGDDCLRRVARLLVDSVGRPGDLVARYGGEEFVCLLPEIDEDGARAVAAKFAAAIEQAAIPHPGAGLDGRLTISIGVATVTDLVTHRPAEAVALADKLLYAAKRAGRDQIAAGLL